MSHLRHNSMRQVFKRRYMGCQIILSGNGISKRLTNSLPRVLFLLSEIAFLVAFVVKLSQLFKMITGTFKNKVRPLRS